MKKYIRRFLPLIGLILMVRLLSKVHWPQVVDSLKTLNPQIIVFIILVNILGITIKSLRWALLLKNERSIKDSVCMFFAAMFYGLVTPGRVGELMKVKYLRDSNFSVKSAWVLTIYDRLFDVCYLLIGTSLFLGFFYQIFYLFVFAVILPFAMFFLVWLVGDDVGLARSKTRFFWIQLLLTVVSYVVYSSGFCVVFSLISIENLFKGVGLVATGNLIALIPASVHGIGIRETVFESFLTLNTAQIVTYSMVHMSITLVSTLIFCYFFVIKQDYKQEQTVQSLSNN
jgi:hypothetical protein